MHRVAAQVDQGLLEQAPVGHHGGPGAGGDGLEAHLARSGLLLDQGEAGDNIGALVRGVRQEDIDKVKEVATNIKTGDLVGFMAGDEA